MNSASIRFWVFFYFIKQKNASLFYFKKTNRHCIDSLRRDTCADQDFFPGGGRVFEVAEGSEACFWQFNTVIERNLIFGRRM